MFYEASLFDANLSQWDVSQMYDMSHMFSGASSFQGIGLEFWDTSATESLTGMFQYSNISNTNLSDWNVSNVYEMDSMFQDAALFEGIGLDHWNISNVNNTAYMFDSATSFNANLSEWDYKNIQNMTNMFHNATSFEGVFWMDE